MKICTFDVVIKILKLASFSVKSIQIYMYNSATYRVFKCNIPHGGLKIIRM